MLEDDYTFPEQLIEVDAPTFEGPDSTSVESSVALFASAEKAQSALETIDHVFVDCRAVFEEYIRRLGEGQAASDADLASAGYTLAYEPLDPPDVGDSAAAFRIRGEAPDIGFTFVAEIVFFRQGRFGATYMFAGQPQGFGVGTDILDTFAERVRSSDELFAQ
jgi:hypothetical protein